MFVFIEYPKLQFQLGVEVEAEEVSLRSFFIKLDENFVLCAPELRLVGEETGEGLICEVDVLCDSGWFISNEGRPVQPYQVHLQCLVVLEFKRNEFLLQECLEVKVG